MGGRQLEGQGSEQEHQEEGQQDPEEATHSEVRPDQQDLPVLPEPARAAASDEACLDARLLLPPLLQELQVLQEVLREPHQLPPRCSSRTLSPGREAVCKFGHLLGWKRPAWRAPSRSPPAAGAPG